LGVCFVVFFCCGRVTIVVDRYEFVKQTVVLSLDKTDRERELAARLLSSLYGYGFDLCFWLKI
jgi:hypothetical protein